MEDVDDKIVDKEFDGVIMITYENTMTRRVGWERNDREKGHRLQAFCFGTF